MKRRVFVAVAAVALVAIAWTTVRFRADLDAAHARLEPGSTIATTPCGPIEYAEMGAGPAVLFVHGAGGGWTQGAAFTAALADDGFRAVAMSRFGYLGTPLPAEGSAEAQADAHACLLDALGVERAAIVGASAGAPSALQFCLRHADRCTALVLLVPAMYVPDRPIAATTPPSPWFAVVLHHVLESDATWWALTHAAPGVLIETALATPLADYRAAPPAERARALAMIDDIFPVSLRAAGLRNDARVIAALRDVPLETIRAPTLAISVENDLYDTHTGARHAAARIPGAKVVAWPTGGHVWLGHDDDVRREMLRFLERHTR